MRRMTQFLMALPVIAGLGLAALPSAQAQPGRWGGGGPGWGRGGPGWGGHHHHGDGGAIAGALIGGLAVGALAGAAMSDGPRGYGYGYGYAHRRRLHLLRPVFTWCRLPPWGRHRATTMQRPAAITPAGKPYLSGASLIPAQRYSGQISLVCHSGCWPVPAPPPHGR